MNTLIIQPEVGTFIWSSKNELTLYWAIKNTVDKYNNYTKLQITY